MEQIKILFVIIATISVFFTPVSGIIIDTQNYSHTLTPAFSEMPVYFDNELKYDTNNPYEICAMNPGGYAVFFPLNHEIFLTGVRLYSSRYSDLKYNLTIEVWDEKYSTIYHYEIPYERAPFRILEDDVFPPSKDQAAWVDVAIPESRVSDDFFLIVFTGPYVINYYGKHGPFIGYEFEYLSKDITSFVVQSNPNRIDFYGPAGIGTRHYYWMIRALYKNEKSVQPESTVTTTSPIITVSYPKALSSPTVSLSPTPTKSAITIPIVFITIMLSIFVFRQK